MAALRNSGNVRAACHAAGISRKTVYQHRSEDAAFAADWDEALLEAIEVIEAEARRRALAGSDNLIMFLLKAHKPEMYAERLRISGDDVRQAAEQLARKHGIPVEQAEADLRQRIKLVS